MTLNWIKPAVTASGSGLPTNVYVIELSRWGINNDGTNPLTTTQGINNALAWAYTNGYTYVKLPVGTYMISKGAVNSDYSVDACIQPQSNTTLDLYGCVIQKETSGWESSVTVNITKKNNVTVLGGKIVGDNDTHDFVTSQGIHEGVIGIAVERGSTNVTLENMDITSFAGYSVCLTGTFSQLAVTSYANWEAGDLDGTGLPKVNASRMRMNTFIQLSTLATASGQGVHDNTSTNGGYFVIWGNGYGTHGTRYDGNPVSLSKEIFEIHCYDASDVYKGFIKKRNNDAVYLNTLPAGTTKFKLVVRYDITQIIPSTFSFQINAFTYSKDIVVRNCKIHDSFSLAIAITGAQQVVIENCEMYRIGNALTGTPGRRLYPFPMAIDIEDGANINQYIIIRNNIFRDNESLHISASHVRNIVIENNQFDPPTNGLSGGVVFQGSRGAGLLSRNNYYNCAVGNGMGNCTFQNDTFADGNMQMQYDATYTNCLFNNMTFSLDAYTLPIWTATAYTAGNSVLPIEKQTEAWINNPLYYVTSSVGATVWGVKRYVVNNLVITTVSGVTRIYKCTVVPGSGNTANQPSGTDTVAYADGYTWQYIADHTEPIWKTDGTDTTDNAGNVWRSFSYIGDAREYDAVKFKDCKFIYNKLETGNWVTRRGAAEFDNCKFSLERTGGYFSDLSNASFGWDHVGKTSFRFTSCDFDYKTIFGIVKGNKISFINSTFSGKSDSSSNAVAIANELVVSNCIFNNFDLKLRGTPQNYTISSVLYTVPTSKPVKSLYFNGNITYTKKTVRATGVANESIHIRNFENVFIENNKAFMTGSTASVRALTVYGEKYLKMTGNYFESSSTNNKLELFGAFRDVDYTLPVPKLTVYMEKNHMLQYPILQDVSYTKQLSKLLGDGLTDIALASIGSTDRVPSEPTSGTYVLGQIIYNSAPIPGGYLGWICTTTGIANNQSWTASNAYALGNRINAGGHVYEVTIAGTSAGSVPTWPTTSGDTVVDGTVTWKEVGILAVFKAFGLISG